MNLHVINTGNFKLDGGAMFGVVPKSIWNKLNPADENNLCNWAMRCLLIEDGKRLILIDTGIGNKQDAKFFGHYYLNGDDTLDKSLAAKGFSRADITDVFLTHLHFDHCGGAIMRDGDKLIPAFPNATYWSNESHWNWAVNPNDREKASFLKENILPIQQSGQLKFIETRDTREFVSESANPLQRRGGVDSTSIHQMPLASAPGWVTPDSLPFSILTANGHTDSMMLPILTYKNRTIVYMADLLPSIAHIPLPYVMAYDMFPLTTLTEKKSFLTEAAAKNYILFFEHDPIHECCELTATEKGVRAGRTFSLSEL
jgi:glyoxylase-like metal-dependent hydrolase (beta-lactamase superfamily II)